MSGFSELSSYLAERSHAEAVPKLDFSKKSSIRCLVMVGTYLHVFPYVEDLERGLSPSDVEGLEQATEDYHFLYNSLVQHFDIYHTYYSSYQFNNTEAEEEGDEKDWEELAYDDICRVSSSSPLLYPAGLTSGTVEWTDVDCCASCRVLRKCEEAGR